MMQKLHTTKSRHSDTCHLTPEGNAALGLGRVEQQSKPSLCRVEGEREVGVFRKRGRERQRDTETERQRER